MQSFPDVGSAISLLRTIDVPKDEALLPTSSDLIATGVAKLRSVTNKGYRAFPVIAAAYGAGGHVLRITKPRSEDYTWTNHDVDKIRLLNLERSEHGYWFTGAAPIEQVVFAINTEGLRSWLAVRQIASTTILRPMVHPFPVSQHVPKEFQDQFTPSRIDANWACTIDKKATRGKAHVDVAFNPWYPRQFAILDEVGYWKTWNIEGVHLGPKKAAPDKSGYMYEDEGLHDAAPKPEDAGWGRLIWVSDVSTIAICNLRCLSMFAIGRDKMRLKAPKVIPKGSKGRILDMKRSPVWLDKFFILTDVRLFLLDTMAAGCQIIMSTPHYREAHGTNLKLELHGRDDTCCTALLYSSDTELVNTYTFRLDTEAPTPVTWTTDAFCFAKPDTDTSPISLQGLSILPAIEPPARYNQNKDGRWYEPHQFYQAFTLSNSFTISQTLLAENNLIAGPAADKPSVYEPIAPPDDSKLVAEKIRTVKKGDTSVDELIAIVPDGLADDIIHGPRKLNVWDMKRASTEPRFFEKKTHYIDAKLWYGIVTSEKPYHCETQQGQCRGHEHPRHEPCSGDNFLEGNVVMADYVKWINHNTHRRRENGLQGLHLIRDLAGFSKFTEDIDDGSEALRGVLKAIQRMKQSDDMTITLRASHVASVLDLHNGKAAEGAQTDLSEVYDKMIEIWVASLPVGTPGFVRDAKERLARNVAADLALSSLMLHFKEKPKIVAIDDLESISATVSLNSSQSTQIQTYPSQRSHLPSETPDPDLPSSQPSLDGGLTQEHSQLLTPAPSVGGSRRGGSVMGEAAEDPSITLLRSYALRVKTQPPLGKARADILSTWEVGTSVKDYRYKPPDLYGTVEADSDDEDAAAAKKKKQEKRERRRTQREFKKLKRKSMLPSQSQDFSGTPSQGQFDRISSGRRSVGAFGSQVSGFGTPVVQRDKRKSMSGIPILSQSQGPGGSWNGGAGTPVIGMSQAPTIGTSFGGGTPQVGTGGGPSQGRSGAPRMSLGGGSFSDRFGGGFQSSFDGGGSQGFGRMSFGGRQSFGGSQGEGSQKLKKKKRRMTEMF